MLAGEYNIIIEQGTTYLRSISIEQPDWDTDPTGETYKPFNLTGYTARMQIRRTIESSTVMLSLTTENGRITVNPQAPTFTNEIFLTISAGDASSLETDGVYDLEIIHGATGVVSKVIRGKVTVIKEVTR